MVFDADAGAGAAGVDDGDVVSADLPLDEFAVFAGEFVGVAAGDFALAALDFGDQGFVGDDQVGQEEVGFFTGSAADVVGVAALVAADVFDVHAVGRVVVRHGHAFEGRHGFGGEDLFGRAEDGDRGRAGGKAELLREVVLAAGAGHGDVQAEEVAFGVAAGDVFREAGTVIVHMLLLCKMGHGGRVPMIQKENGSRG